MAGLTTFLLRSKENDKVFGCMSLSRFMLYNQFRDIEMRYFLPADVLMLVLGAVCVAKMGRGRLVRRKVNGVF